MNFQAKFFGRKVSMNTLADLSKSFCRFRDHGLKRGTVLRRASSLYIPVMQNGVQIAYISWNGRIWEGVPQSVFATGYKEPKCLFDPKGQI